MLADQLYTVRVTLVEGESFDILVGSGSGEGVSWARRTENFVVSVHLGAREILTWAVERERRQRWQQRTQQLKS